MGEFPGPLVGEFSEKAPFQIAIVDFRLSTSEVMESASNF